MTRRTTPYGGIVHTYQKYNPQRFPSPTQPPPDLVSPLMQHWLAYGKFRRLSEEELARAIRIDPSQLPQLGPSIDLVLALLLERRRKILSTFETDTVQQLAHRVVQQMAEQTVVPTKFDRAFREAIEQQQLYDLEQIWYRVADDTSPFARQLVLLMERMGEQYQVDELAAKYPFTGRTAMTIPQALEIKEELEKIDELLKQLEQARQTGQIAIIDLDALSQFVESGDMQMLEEMQHMVENYVREMAERQGLELAGGQFQLTPQAFRVFQNKLLARIFIDLKAARSGRHQGAIAGEGAVEMQQTKPYEFGDSLANLDIPQTLINALVRDGPGLPVRIKSDDIAVHLTRNAPKCATVIAMDMSGSMRYDGQYINVKRMALALDGLIRTEYPGDFLGYVEMYTFGRVRRASEIVDLMPKPVTLFDPIVRLSVDMSRSDVSEHLIHQHFTNIQHALQLARNILSAQSTPNRQIVLITDGLPTAHFQGSILHLMYPPHPHTESITLREGARCRQAGITINLFLVPSWSQSEEDIRFAYRLAESTAGRVFFTAGEDLDRYVVWDYLQRKREILG